MFICLDVTSPTNLTNLFQFKANDSDSDAKLQYELSNVECIDIFGQKTECASNVQLEKNGSMSLSSSASVRNAQFATIRIIVTCNDINHPIESEAKSMFISSNKQEKSINVFSSTTHLFRTQ